MTKKQEKHYLQKLDEFLGLFDPEELIRDGIDLIRFRYEYRGKKITRTFTPHTLKEEKEKRACNT
jgi:hypothetical protein